MVTDSAERSNSLVPLTDVESLNELFARSESNPIILFKHSLTCPISSGAYQQMKGLNGEVDLIVIQEAREVSMEVERLTGVRHESPQVIIVRRREAVWNASHWEITAAAVEGAFRAAQ